MTAVSQALAPGLVLGRDFEIVRLLRKGGMGSVYLATQRTTGAPRAVKVMRSSLASDPRFLSRFEMEARVSSRVASDHVVQVVSAGLDEDNHVPFIAMELLEGDDLSDWLAAHHRMQPADARLVIGQLCHALGAAHSVGVVHRDLKPENVFLARSRVVGVPFMVKVLDFGVAKIVSEARVATVAVGTPYYMAPEQTYPSADIGPQADVWALGLLVYRLLTGRTYWRTADGPEESLASLWREVLIDPLPDPRQRATEQGVADLLPPELDAWLSRCIVREAPDRYADANAAWAELSPILDAVAGTATATAAPSSGGSGAGSPRDLVATMSARSLGELPNRSMAASKERTRPRVTFREGGERVVASAEPGQTLLQVSLDAGLPHYHACGGRARCTTCRVVVLDGLQGASPPSDAEKRVAAARNWPGSIRLACQLKVTQDLTVRRLVVDQHDANAVNALHVTQEPTVEEAVVIAVEVLGFAEFARTQFPHDAIHVLNRYLKHAVDPVVSNRGKVLRYTTRGVVCIFDAPGGTPESRALDAVRAALRIVARVRQLNPYTLKHFGHEFDVAIGIDAGQVMKAEVGHPDRAAELALGEAIDGADAVLAATIEGDLRIGAGDAVLRALGDRLRTGRTQAAALGRTATEILDFAKSDVVFLVQNSFEQVAHKSDAFAMGFYERLFDLHPPSEPLFAHTDMTQQREMLMDVLATAVRGLDRLEELLPTLRELGRRHVGYGVTPAHYKFVGRALLETLEEFLGHEFTPEVHVAWLEIYGTLARTMLEAASTPSGEAPQP